MSNPIFDIVVCHGPNDNIVLEHNIKYNSKNVIGYRNIYVITHDKNLKSDYCTVIWEGIFPFNINHINIYDLKIRFDLFNVLLYFKE